MRYGKKLFLGLLAASSWVIPGTMKAADFTSAKRSAGQASAPAAPAGQVDHFAQQASALVHQLAPKATPTAPASATITADGAITVTDAVPTNSTPNANAWKKVEGVPSADIRFKKPALTRANAQSTQIAESAAKKPGIQQLQAAALAAAVPAPAATAPQVSIAAYAKPVQPAAASSGDNQLQLVARIQDSDVRHAAEDEPLPVTPQEQGSNGANAANGNNANSDNLTNRDTSYNSDGVCCDTGCCEPQPCLFWTAGVEATFLNPDINSRGGPSFAVERFEDDRYDYCSTDSSDLDSLYMSPRIWLGVQGCCWGMDVRYWHMQASEGEYDPSIGGLGSWDDYDCGRPDLGFFSCSRLEAYTIDLELTRRFCINACQMQAALGVRHADLQINQGITGLASTEEGILSGFARANRQVRGTGLLLGLYGRKPIFPCSCVSWFYNARWSALWGPTQTAAETFAAVQSSDPDYVASAGSVNGAYTNVDDTLFIGEFQLGLEWDYALRCLPANAFFRAAVEYQRWDGGSGSSAANSFAGITVDSGIDPTSVVSTQASALAPQLDLIGFTLGTGLTW